jgi:hypothetical protein
MSVLGLKNLSAGGLIYSGQSAIDIDNKGFLGLHSCHIRTRICFLEKHLNKAASAIKLLKCPVNLH